MEKLVSDTGEDSRHAAFLDSTTMYNITYNANQNQTLQEP